MSREHGRRVVPHINAMIAETLEEGKSAMATAVDTKKSIGVDGGVWVCFLFRARGPVANPSDVLREYQGHEEYLRQAVERARRGEPEDELMGGTPKGLQGPVTYSDVLQYVATARNLLGVIGEIAFKELQDRLINELSTESLSSAATERAVDLAGTRALFGDHMREASRLPGQRRRSEREEALVALAIEAVEEVLRRLEAGVAGPPEGA